MRRSGLILLWVVTVAWAAQIYSFSTATFGGVFTTWLLSQILKLLHMTVTFPTFLLLHHLMRKGAHVTEYALFSMLLYYSLGGSRRREWRKQAGALGASHRGRLFAERRISPALRAGTRAFDFRQRN